MRRVILPALLLLVCALPSSGQYGRYGDAGDRDAERTVHRWYERFLGRDPDAYAGGHVRALRAGTDPEQVLAGILGSDEYYRRAGGTPARFVSRLYVDAIGRRPTPGEEASGVRQLYHSSRVDVAYSILTRHAQSWDDDDHDRDRGRDWSDRHDYRRPQYRYR